LLFISYNFLTKLALISAEQQTGQSVSCSAPTKPKICVGQMFLKIISLLHNSWSFQTLYDPTYRGLTSKGAYNGFLAF